MLRSMIALCFFVLVLPGSGCENNNGVKTQPTIPSVIIKLRFNGPRFSGTLDGVIIVIAKRLDLGDLPATDFAVWIEDTNGHYVRTLGISKSVVSLEHFRVHHLPTWEAKSGITYEDLKEETEKNLAFSFDAVSSASVYFRENMADTTLVFEWDLKDGDGDDVLKGEYYYFVEVANIEKWEENSCQIKHESTCGLIGLNEESITLADPTEHILALSAEYRYNE